MTTTDVNTAALLINEGWHLLSSFSTLIAIHYVLLPPPPPDFPALRVKYRDEYVIDYCLN